MFDPLYLIGHRPLNARWNRMKTAITFVLLACCLSACSLKSNFYLETLRTAALGVPDVNKSAAEVDSIPYASAYLTIGSLPQPL